MSNKKPFYKKPWFIVIAVIVVIAAVVPKNKSEKSSENNSKTATDTSVQAAENKSANTTAVEVSSEEAATTVAETEVQYTTYSVNDLMSELEENALKASENHKGENVRITGRLGAIDSSGKYISLLPDDQFAFIGVTCYIKNDETKAKVSELSKDAQVTLTGNIKDVGEVLGYSLNIDNIE